MNNYKAVIFNSQLGGTPQFLAQVGFTNSSGVYDPVSLQANIDDTMSLSQIKANIISAVQAYAATAGYTVTGYLWLADGYSPAIPFQSYQALVGQTGTSAPSATQVNNDFGSTTFTWARTGAGVYTLTASAATFTAGKTGVLVKPLDNLNGSIKAVVTSSTVITITTAVQSLAVLGLLGFTATPTDAMLAGTLVEVRVYP